MINATNQRINPNKFPDWIGDPLGVLWVLFWALWGASQASFMLIWGNFRFSKQLPKLEKGAPKKGAPIEPETLDELQRRAAPVRRACALVLPAVALAAAVQRR